MKEFTVTTITSEQITEDRWRAVRKCLKVTSDTTIGEIEGWYRAFHITGPMTIEVVELENIVKQ